MCIFGEDRRNSEERNPGLSDPRPEASGGLHLHSEGFQLLPLLLLDCWDSSSLSSNGALFEPGLRRFVRVVPSVILRVRHSSEVGQSIRDPAGQRSAADTDIAQDTERSLRRTCVYRDVSMVTVKAPGCPHSLDDHIYRLRGLCRFGALCPFPARERHLWSLEPRDEQQEPRSRLREPASQQSHFGKPAGKVHMGERHLATRRSRKILLEPLCSKYCQSRHRRRPPGCFLHNHLSHQKNLVWNCLPFPAPFAPVTSDKTLDHCNPPLNRWLLKMSRIYLSQHPPHVPRFIPVRKKHQ
ncbi:hypothetical protein AGIG_G10411 [Arapaima gigas]